MSMQVKNLGLFSVNMSIFHFCNKHKYDNWQISNVDEVVKGVSIYYRHRLKFSYLRPTNSSS